MEHEIRRHVRNIWTGMARKKTSIWKKIGELLVEVIIIVFAVSFAVFVERQREHSHEQQEVKEFLIGLKVDLQNDIKEMNEDKGIYKTQGRRFTYFAAGQLDKDSVKKHEWIIWNTVHLLVNSGRYEGFKASGKINTIKNVELRNNILDLYQETLVALTNNTAGYNEMKRDFHKLFYKYRVGDGAPDDNLLELLKTTEIKNYCLRLRFTGEVVRRYDSAIVSSERIVKLINKEYPE